MSTFFATFSASAWRESAAAALLFNAGGRSVHLHDAAELVHFAIFPLESAVVAISRTGQSAWIVQVMDRACASGATMIGVTLKSERIVVARSVVVWDVLAIGERRDEITGRIWTPGGD
jgi:D-arabinose 5-phosphate isomerase GutQ